MMVPFKPWEECYDICDKTGCWIWNCALDRDGYGHKYWNGKQIPAHRAMWFRFGRTLDPGQVLRHTCDNPACVNPDHLLPGTDADNSLDAVRRSRTSYGETHRSAKLTEADVVSIRERRFAGESASGLAREFGVGTAQITLICTGRKWKRAGGPIVKPRPSGPRSGRKKQEEWSLPDPEIYKRAE